MSRNTRTFVVMGIAIALATAASFGIYRAIRQIPVREVEVAHHSAVVASHDLPLGTLVTKDDVKLVAWPSSDPLPGGFDTVEKVLNRGVVAPVMKNEPLAESKLAPIEAGAGLPPTIPTGMRRSQSRSTRSSASQVSPFLARAWMCWRWFAITTARCRESSSATCWC